MGKVKGDIKNGFGTAPVFFTAISTILGAILFLRFGYAVGTLGLFGVFLIILIGHLVSLGRHPQSRCSTPAGTDHTASLRSPLSTPKRPPG